MGNTCSRNDDRLGVSLSRALSEERGMQLAGLEEPLA